MKIDEYRATAQQLREIYLAQVKMNEELIGRLKEARRPFNKWYLRLYRELNNRAEHLKNLAIKKWRGT